jgi:tRNA-dihydrouridine synthase A
MPIATQKPEISVAPMMDWTDRDCRYFMRLLSPGIRLYTEMVTARAILHGPAQRLLAFDPAEHPVALQLGGSVPDELGRAAALARAQYPYDEINLNVGCPSDRVQSGRFGACLMAEPELVADCVRAIADNWSGRVSVKTRIGIDDCDDYAFLARFVRAVADAGCRHFIVHARKAILSGLSPKQNRTVPPLRYPQVWQLAEEFPQLHIVINGGLTETALIDTQLERVDGVMLGRKAYSDPYFLVTLQNRYLGGFAGPPPTRADVLRDMAGYAERRLGSGGRLVHICRHLLGLYAGQPGAARWRRFIAESSRERDAGPEILMQSLQVFDRAA